jgi:hypothetical protein
MSSLRTMLVGPEHAAGLDELFQASGSPCFCRFWHFNGTNNEWLDICANAPRQNADAFREALVTGNDEARGIVALIDERGFGAQGAEGDPKPQMFNQVVGWLKVAPAQVMRKAYERRFYKQLPVLQALVAAAVEQASSLGAKVLEALPCRPKETENVMDEALWTGPMGAYLTNGFVEVGGFDMYPVLRRELATR